MRRCVTLLLIALTAGMSVALQIQCYQCEDVRQDDCTSPEFIVNCTVNVQDMCQKEVLVMEDVSFTLELCYCSRNASSDADLSSAHGFTTGSHVRRQGHV
ncbi:ly6/PLAUR domain-containing protein 1-like isoform X2 [Carassius carassius]|uniref:ly6/PLAUR domain-containing protein 1-like isoform X2 n=1 Tax=Carassius carassius TaxID=217509 RepID=UPI00286969AC|nr:ly6/PLAUR domain-containing protein 1-like isoform X2 [Carassius carassius]